MKKSESAGDRMRRLLALMPWLRERPGVEIADAATHFGLTEEQLLDDLAVVFMVGLPPYSPDALVDVIIEDGKIWISYADFFRRPMRLTPGQGLALLAASEALLSVQGSDVDGSLARALEKLASSLDVTPEAGVEVRLGQADQGVLRELRDAAGSGQALEISYYSYGRDELTDRTILPWRVFADSGAWYVEAFCGTAGGARLFRVDRIGSLVPTDTKPDAGPDGGRRAGPEKAPDTWATVGAGFESSGSTVRLQLGPEAAWVSETYPCEVVSTFADGSTVIDIMVSARPWLERLLLRLGQSSSVIEGGGFGEPASLRTDAARRILARYER